MNAWLLDDFVGLKGLRLAEVPDPVPAEGEVVLDLEYAALNPAGSISRAQCLSRQADRFHACCSASDGIRNHLRVLQSASTQFQIGQRVLIIRGDCGVNRWGTFAERIAIPIESIASPPAGWTVQQAGCAALVYLTGYQALTQWEDLTPSVVLITGASGGVGVATIHLAKAKWTMSLIAPQRRKGRPKP